MRALILLASAGGNTVPIIAMDHILADHRVGVASAEILGVPGTDHRGVFADLRLPTLP
ncbi:hypothetical protein [Nonomuraea angiospora]